MLKLYKIMMTHYAPKGCESAINEYVVAENDKQVFDYLAKGYAYWQDILEYCEDYYDEYEKALSVYNDIFENKGDIREVEDLYYGATQYSWEEVELKDSSVIELMIINGLAKDISEVE